MKKLFADRLPLQRDKNILLYYIYSVIYGLYPINAVVALFFIAKGLTFAQIGIVFTVFSLSSFIFEIPTGYWGDKYGRRKSILLGLWILTIVSFLWTMATNYIHFSVLAGFWMLGFAFISGSFEAYIYDYLENSSNLSHYDSILAKSSMLFFYSGSIGAIMGTYLYAYNHYFPYYLLSLTFFLSSLAVFLMDKDVIISAKTGDLPLQMLSGLKKIFSSRNLIWVTAFISFFFGYYHFFINSVNTPYLLSLNLFETKYLGILMAIVAAIQGTISSKFGYFRAKMSDTYIIILLSMVQVIMLLIMGYYTGIIGLIGFVIFTQIEPFEGILLNSFSQKYISSNIRATTISSMKLIGAIAASGIGYLVGTLVDKVGIITSFSYVSAGICSVLVMLFLIKNIYQIKL